MSCGRRPRASASLADVVACAAAAPLDAQQLGLLVGELADAFMGGPGRWQAQRLLERAELAHMLRDADFVEGLGGRARLKSRRLIDRAFASASANAAERQPDGDSDSGASDGGHSNDESDSGWPPAGAQEKADARVRAAVEAELGALITSGALNVFSKSAADALWRGMARCGGYAAAARLRASLLARICLALESHKRAGLFLGVVLKYAGAGALGSGAPAADAEHARALLRLIVPAVAGRLDGAPAQFAAQTELELRAAPGARAALADAVSLPTFKAELLAALAPAEASDDEADEEGNLRGFVCYEEEEEEEEAGEEGRDTEEEEEVRPKKRLRKLAARRKRLRDSSGASALDHLRAL